MCNLIIIGPFPPPRHGVSAVNEAVGDRVKARSAVVTVINTAPPSLSRRWRSRIRRIGVIVAAWRSLRHLLRKNRAAMCYFSLSGGFGLLYECLLIWFARQKCAGIVMHHHSFRYLSEPFWPMQWAVKIAGTEALHVVLGQTMADRLQAVYPRVQKTLVLSNAAWMPSVAEAIERRTLRTIGLLSNLSVAKGLDDFVVLAEASAARGLPWRFVLAGPFENQADEPIYQARFQALPNLDYRGPLYGESKKNFLDEIDVFLFPTRYRNEAEPLVVLEALSHGHPVIAFGRGCIPEMIGTDGGRVIPVGTDFAGPALEQLESWRGEGEAFQRRREAAQGRFEARRAQAMTALPKLLEALGGNPE